MEDHFTTGSFPYTFLFEPWVISTVLALVFTCIAVGATALLFEGMRVMRVWVKRQLKVDPLFPIISKNIHNGNNPEVNVPANISYIRSNKIKNHVFQTVLHLVRVIAGYFLMLAFMTYNVYICASILLGAALGYFLFCHELSRWRELEPCNDHLTPATSVSSSGTTAEEAHPMLPTTSTNHCGHNIAVRI